MKFDVAIVGAGIVGLAVAHELRLREPAASIVVIDASDDVAAHQSGHNSGVIHSGLYYSPGSLKARLCVDGAARMVEFCTEHAVRFERCGKLVVAIRRDELGRLDELERRGHANGVPGLRRIAGDEITEFEPNAVGLAALHAPGTSIVDYAHVCRALRRELEAGGVQFRLGTRVTGLSDDGRHVTVTTAARAQLVASRVVVCAGLWSGELADWADPRIVPFRGAYLRLRPAAEPIVRGMVYPVPDPDLPFLGVHVTRHIDGHVLLGPSARLVLSPHGLRTLAWPGTWQVARRFWRTGLHELHLAASRRAFLEEATQYVPSLATADIESTRLAGVRAQAVGRDGTLVDDFVIDHARRVTHVRNAPSPAATSSFAIASSIVDRLASP
jgi:L-2-hydroxyglutarate oxidase